MSFTGFPNATREFLAGISANNSKDWFEAHRALYDEGYVAPARAFVEAIGPALRKISPEVQFEAKINGSISRINRDIRFSSDKRPYKAHLDLFFWHGEKKGWDRPGFFLRLTPKVVWVGTGMHGFDKDMLTRFRDAVIDDRAGNALTVAARKVTAGPYVVGGRSRKLVPRGYDADSPRAEYLLYEGLYAHHEGPAADAYAPEFGAAVLKHFRATWPVARWILDEVVG